ncbi:DUF5403 family protein [Allokutzneria sp. A3M-2-11 16]|nr:DUF5403 family protein [Allokutzneria sp. A3M-2-11 16]
MRGVRHALIEHAEGIAATARADLGQHRHGGDARITRSRGTVDSFVSLEDPAAEAIEFGHLAPDGTVVEGLHILTRAADL